MKSADISGNKPQLFARGTVDLWLIIFKTDVAFECNLLTCMSVVECKLRNFYLFRIQDGKINAKGKHRENFIVEIWLA